MEEELHSYLAEERAFFAPPDLGLVASAATTAPAVTATYAPKTLTVAAPTAPSVTATTVAPKTAEPPPPAPTSRPTALTTSHYVPPPPPPAEPTKPTGEDVKVPEIVFGPPPTNTVPAQSGGPLPPVDPPTNPPARTPGSGGSSGKALIGLGAIGLLIFLVVRREKQDAQKRALQALPADEDEDDQ